MTPIAPGVSYCREERLIILTVDGEDYPANGHLTESDLLNAANLVRAFTRKMAKLDSPYHTSTGHFSPGAPDPWNDLDDDGNRLTLVELYTRKQNELDSVK